MKLNLKTPVATALMITAMALIAPASAAEVNCVVKKDGFTWNECGDKLRGKAVAGVPALAPGGAGPNAPAGDEPETVSIFGLSLDTGPAPFDPQKNGSNPHGGGAGDGR